jgi:hypothetical protein
LLRLIDAERYRLDQTIARETAAWNYVQCNRISTPATRPTRGPAVGMSGDGEG